MSIRIYFVVLFFTTAFTKTSFSQKLPNVQTISVVIPAGMKVDGKPLEINGFQAYNHSTDIFYTIANNNDRLYFIVQAIDPVTIKKILSGGLTLSMNQTGNKSQQGSVQIMYPVFPAKTQSKAGHNLSEITDLPPGPSKKSQSDSLIKDMNDTISKNVKFLRVTGIKSITDTLISVYNSNGIRTAAAFDATGALTIELALPLKDMPFAENKGFTYNMMINGLESTYKTTEGRAVNGDKVTIIGFPTGLMTKNLSNFQSMRFPTDFWGNYVLAK